MRDFRHAPLRSCGLRHGEQLGIDEAQMRIVSTIV